MSPIDWSFVGFIAVLIAALAWALWELRSYNNAMRRITERMKAANDEIESEVGEP